MTTLLLSILFGIGFSYLAIQNTAGVSVRFAGYMWTGIPLYLIALGALLVGLLVAWLFNIVDWASTSLTIHGKDAKLSQAKQLVEDLQEKIHNLELENAQLRGEKKEELEEEHEFHKQPSPNLLARLRHNLSV